MCPPHYNTNTWWATLRLYPPYLWNGRFRDVIERGIGVKLSAGFSTGSMFFYTVVAFQRRHIFDQSKCRTMLREAIGWVRQRYPFFINAWVLLPGAHALYVDAS